MNFKLEYLRNKIRTDITKQSGNVGWTSDENLLSISFEFEFAKINDNKIVCGDIIYFDDLTLNTNVFTGIVTSISKGEYKDTVRCNDFAFYLNSSKTIIQFNEVPGTKALKSLFLKSKIEFNNIAEMNTIISMIYKDKYISEIISDILNQVYLETGKKYLIEMEGNKINIIEQSLIYIDEVCRLASNLPVFKIQNAIEKTATVNVSIENLRNSVIVTSKDSNDMEIIESIKDEISIKNYGLLQEIIEVDSKDESQARNIAKTVLNDLNKISEISSLTFIGNSNVKAGRLIKLNIENINLVGDFIVKSVNHKIASGAYTMMLNVEGV